MAYKIDELTYIELGYLGENDVTDIQIDASAWLEKWPTEKYLYFIVAKRSQDNIPYVAATTMEGGILTWRVRRADVSKNGVGSAQVEVIGKETDECKKSAIFRVLTDKSLSQPDVGAEELMQDYVQQLIAFKPIADRAEYVYQQTITDLEAEGAAQRQQIQQKGAETLASIPDDYSDLFAHVDDIVKVQDAQPVSEYNKLWIKETPSEGIEIPTWRDHQDSKEMIDGLVTARDEHAVAIGRNTAMIDGLVTARDEHAIAIGRNTTRIDELDQAVKAIEVHNGGSILRAVMAAYDAGFHRVNVHAGEYDIIEEYKAAFGSDYFDTYSGVYNGNRHAQYDYGLWLDNMTIRFDAGARVFCNYTGTNADVQAYFCAFAIGSNVEIDGLVLDARNLRYGIHPDFSTIHTGDYVVFRNCDLHHYAKGRNNECIGAGLGVHTTMIFEGCIFRSDMSGECLRIHNNHVAEAQSVIIMHGCYFDGAGHVAFNRYGPSTLMTDIYVSGCCWENPPVLGQEIPTQPAYNMRMKKWANETIEFDIVDGNA